jgi:DNA-binding CsgD family transcriptional regulator
MQVFWPLHICFDKTNRIHYGINMRSSSGNGFERRRDIMSPCEKTEIIVQKIKGMQDGLLVGHVPEEAAVWDRLLDNPLVNCLSVGIVLLDSNFNIQKSNDKYREFISKYSIFTQAETTGKSYFRCFPEAEKTVLEQFLYAKLTSTSLDSQDSPLVRDKADGSGQETTYWNAHISPLKSTHCTEGFVLLAIDVTERITNKKRIHDKDCEIEELKTTLKTLLRLKGELEINPEENMTANARHLLIPFVEKLKLGLVTGEQLRNISGAGAATQNFATDFSLNLVVNNYGLTPKEMQIAAMINAGKTTKVIAEYFHLSTDTIDFHRKTIRKKLGFKNKNINLQTALSSLFLKR